ncbi:DUF3108 domain-containing protein [Photobacterium iliopiscarium]|uniref:DUF3108 domain-containing protein n=1 Tax=Photobacterium iliopiscarium TaxID=56192 RepID=UPI000D160F7F|nr:DUF3108 domain-containing protein [Photobacterium iliopiscarium]PST95075.1 DUF3108 domain-containing protein [Photobacterium iliopiscarium]
MRLLPIMTFSLVSLFTIAINANADTLVPSSIINSNPIPNSTLTKIKSTPNPLLPNQNNKCNKTLNYNVFFEGHDIGNYQRNLVWNGTQADIYTKSTVNVLITKAKLSQHSKLHWSPQRHSFVTDSFERKINGLMTGTVSATFTDNGKKSTVIEDGKSHQFNETLLPILDGDTIGVQMRLDIMQGKKNFDFILQNSDDTSHYYFKVIGEETIATNFGDLKTIRVDQIKKNDRKLSLWFAPSIDYQLVRATYKRKLLDLKAVLVSKQIICPAPVLIK